MSDGGEWRTYSHSLNHRQELCDFNRFDDFIIFAKNERGFHSLQYKVDLLLPPPFPPFLFLPLPFFSIVLICVCVYITKFEIWNFWNNLSAISNHNVRYNSHVPMCCVTGSFSFIVITCGKINHHFGLYSRAIDLIKYAMLNIRDIVGCSAGWLVWRCWFGGVNGKAGWRIFLSLL